LDRTLWQFNIDSLGPLPLLVLEALRKQ
jgi:hypothetical protein